MNRVFLRSVSLSAALCSTPALAEAEPWYTYWGIGVASNDYPRAVDAAFSRAESVPDAQRPPPMSVEMFGFYWPLAGTSTIVGVIVDGSIDSATRADQTDIVAFDQDLYAFSAMHFWGDEPGQGFFVRGDAGVAAFEFSSGNGTASESGNGFGLLIGAGYGIPVSAQSRLIFNLTYSSKLMNDETYSTLAFNVAGLW